MVYKRYIIETEKDINGILWKIEQRSCSMS